MQAHKSCGALRPLYSSFALAGVLGLTGCAPAPVTPDTAAAEPAPVAQPQHPDFSGVWMAIGVENPGGTGNAPTYSAAGQERMAAFTAQYTDIPEAGQACVGSGMPGVMLSLVSYPIEIAQTDSRLLMVAELETQVRRVFIDGRTRSAEVFPTNQGYSLGTWDGDVLVIDTVLFEEWSLPPWPRSPDARITERFSLTTNDQISARRTGFIAGVLPPINDDVLVVDITIEDPAYYEGPQRRLAYYQRMADEATSEYACSQGLWQDELDKRLIDK